MAEPAAGGSNPPAPAQQTGIKKKIGPLPIWAWALLLAAVGFIWWKFLGPGKTAAAAPKSKGGGGGRTEVVEVRGQRGPAGPRGPAGKKNGPKPELRKVDVPDVRGEPYRKAGEEIKDRGLIAQRSAPFVGRVRSESPHPGAKVEKGSVITLRGKPWKIPGGGGGGGAQVQAPDMASAGQVITPQSPAFQAWNDDGTGEAMPAFAPMTAGSIHG